MTFIWGTFHKRYHSRKYKPKDSLKFSKNKWVKLWTSITGYCTCRNTDRGRESDANLTIDTLIVWVMECLWVFWNKHPMLFWDTRYHPTHSFRCTEFTYHWLSALGLSVWLHIFHNFVLSPLYIKCANQDDSILSFLLYSSTGITTKPNMSA